MLTSPLFAYRTSGTSTKHSLIDPFAKGRPSSSADRWAQGGGGVSIKKSHAAQRACPRNEPGFRLLRTDAACVSRFRQNATALCTAIATLESRSVQQRACGTAEGWAVQVGEEELPLGISELRDALREE